MTQSERKKRRQVIILLALSVLLIGVVYWQYLLMPKLNACDELNSEIADNEDILADMQAEIIAIPGYERDIDDTISKIGEDAAELYPLMNNEDADIMILGNMEKSGLTASSLSVVTAAAESSGKEPADTGVYVITASYEASGSYSALLSFISKMNELPAVSVGSVRASAAETENETYVVGNGKADTVKDTIDVSENDMTFEITVRVFMYAAPEIPDHFAKPYDDNTSGTQTGEIDDFL